MTDKKSALEAFDNGASGTFLAPEGMPTQTYKFTRDQMRLIRTALNDAPEVVTVDQFDFRLATCVPAFTSPGEHLMKRFPNGVKVIE